MTPYELVLPARFAEYMEGTHLLQTRDAQGDSDGVSVLKAWDNSTLRRGQRVLTIDFDQEGRSVLNYIREYGETVVWAGTAEYTRGERTAARKVLERIAEINTQYRAAKQQKEAEPVEQPQETDVHTEHCCSIHGCKYACGSSCTVESGAKKQSFPCEQCDDEDEEFLRGFAEGKKRVLQTIRENIDAIFEENLPMAACELAIRWLNEYMEENE